MIKKSIEVNLVVTKGCGKRLGAQGREALLGVEGGEEGVQLLPFFYRAVGNVTPWHVLLFPSAFHLMFWVLLN